MEDDNAEGLKLGAIIIALIILLFWGVLFAMKKFFAAAPEQPHITSSDQIKDQQRRMDDIREQQDRLMQNQKQKIRDLRRNY